MPLMTKARPRVSRRIFTVAALLMALVAVGATSHAALPGIHSVAYAASGCQLNSAKGNIQHVISVQFDNVHFTRDNANIPSDLEQMPHLLNFMESNGVVLTN
ncbi:MAG TPA: hypothetical protein VF898_12440, partial [Chloroflexota bacterium]